MASRFCAACRRHWPTEGHDSCPICDAPTFVDANARPGYMADDPEVKIPDEPPAPGTQATTTNHAREWRVERYLELGFTVLDANLLADARDSVRIEDRKKTPRTWTFPLNWQKVAKSIDAGCTHEMAVVIYA